MIVLEQQGGVLAAYDPNARYPSPEKPPQRGDVTEFSRKSRRRLMVLLNRLSYEGRVSFLTLTFHGEPTLSEANAAFKRFRAWLTYAVPGVSAVWRRERQPGRGSYHYHLLVYGLPFIAQTHVQEMWTRCTREDRSIVDIRRVHSRKQAMKYVSKYIAKLPETEGTTSLENSPYLQKRERTPQGRAWGVINADGLPYAPCQTFAFNDDKAALWLWLKIQEETQSKCGNDDRIAILLGDEGAGLAAFVRGRARYTKLLDPDLGKICYNPTEKRKTALINQRGLGADHDRVA